MISGATDRGGGWDKQMKVLSLIALTLQNSALILVMHYSRIMSPVNGLRYLPSTCVLLNELIKTSISVACAFKESTELHPPGTPSSTRFKSLVRSLLTGDSWKLAIPAGLYTLQNTLQYVAVSNLDAATFQVTYQLKILTTAMFSVMLLGRSLSTRKWMSLVLLIVGVSIVQFPTSTPEPAPSRFSDWHNLLDDIRSSANDAVTRFLPSSLSKEEAFLLPHMSRSLGLFAVLTSCALSGLAGVLFEMILKSSRRSDSDTAPVSLWVRNSQLSFWSLFPALFIGVIAKDGTKVAEQGFFGGYNWVVWCVVGLQATGGVVVSFVINYADNIAKNFATSVSVVASCVVSVWAFGFQVTREFILGTCVVLFATWLYTQPEKTSTVLPVVKGAETETGSQAKRVS